MWIGILSFWRVGGACFSLLCAPSFWRWGCWVGRRGGCLGGGRGGARGGWGEFLVLGRVAVWLCLGLHRLGGKEKVILLHRDERRWRIKFRTRSNIPANSVSNWSKSALAVIIRLTKRKT